MAASTVEISNFARHRTQKNTNDQYPLSLLPKCTSLGELKQIQAFAIKTHLQNDVSVLTKLIKLCTLNPTTASMHHAHHLFDQIPQPDIILFNTVARGYARSEAPLLAVALYARTLSAADGYTFPSLLKACAAAKALAEGKQLHSLAVRHGLGLHAHVSPALINMYAACGDLRSARRAFDSAPPCAVAHNAIISGYARSGLPNEALALFRDLQARARAGPTDAAVLSALSCCAALGALGLGRWAHEYAKRRGLDRLVKVGTSLVDMYSKCGSLEDAASVFDKMPVKDTMAWSAMITAHATHGRVSDAFQLFDEMQTKGFEPDEVTFLGLLSACSHTGSVQKGLEIFSEMSQNHNVAPNIKHLGCVVDLLCRSGRLKEAYDFIDELPVTSSSPAILWRTLLSACCRRGDYSLGKQSMARILEPDAGDYVMLSNLCAKTGRRDEVDSLRRAMKVKGAAKVPGCSAVEVDNSVHEFFAGDSVSGDLVRFLDELVKELKVFGYVPEVSLVSHDMGDEEKELALRYHSEKLAIAYGLLNTSSGTTIRVVKNLRVCGDCHTAIKFVSLVTKRVIVLRDVQRFHHFKEGKCSCGDYW